MVELTHYFNELAVSVLGFVWLMAAVGKLTSMPSFRENLHQSFGIPSSLTLPFTWILLFCEAGLGALLFLGSSDVIPLALWTSLALLGGFSVVIAHTLLKGKRVQCNCFGQSNEPLDALDLLRNLILMLLCMSPLLIEKHVTLPGLQPLILAVLGLGVSLVLVNIKLLALVWRDPKGSAS